MKKLGKSIYLTAMVLSLLCVTTVSAADVKNAGSQQEINGFLDFRLVEAIKLVSDDARTPINAADRAQSAEDMSDLMIQVTRSLVKFAEAEDKANGECAQNSNNMEEFLMQLNNFKM
ncbi:MAG: hypothetical protein NC338_05715 [Firmicutes bacterium]|nr:hypothetical protein [Bacillota bacterium]MCM1401575.1 hypothetical protein [Bacteroides sp.]MCM1477459.1 hypothetical protein [Bacteroides sp.]